MKSSYIIIESIKILFFYAFYKNFSQLLLDKNDNSLLQLHTLLVETISLKEDSIKLL